MRSLSGKGVGGRRKHVVMPADVCSTRDGRFFLPHVSEQDGFL